MSRSATTAYRTSTELPQYYHSITEVLEVKPYAILSTHTQFWQRITEKGVPDALHRILDPVLLTPTVAAFAQQKSSHT